MSTPMDLPDAGRSSRPGAGTITVVVPSFNSARWLPSTLAACNAALARCSWRADVLVVDDGSTDGTAELVQELARTSPVPLRVLTQPNRGRFLARWAGLQAADGETVLLLDSRVLLDPGALEHVERRQREEPEARVWNGHAVTDPTAPLVGHFWEVPTHLFWGSYLRRPRPVTYGIEDFERYPKGTTFFLAPRDVLVAACLAVWPDADASLSSDDTKVIRWMAARGPIHLDPGFRAVYRPRGNVRDFVRHSFGRGTFLVDSFGGTTTAWNVLLIGLAAAPLLAAGVLAVLLAARLETAALAVLLAGLAALAAPGLLALARGCQARGVAAYLVYVPVFCLPYWAGLLRGLKVHGRLLLSTRARDGTTAGSRA